MKATTNCNTNSKFKFKGIALLIDVYGNGLVPRSHRQTQTKRPGRGKSLHCLINSVTVRVTSSHPNRKG